MNNVNDRPSMTTSEKMKDYSMYRYFKGEKENPFDNKKQNTPYQFWEYENMFEHKFETNTQYHKKDKKKSFNKWLNDLFVHLADKYESFDNGERFRIKYEVGD